jgi:hypothetical protein
MESPSSSSRLPVHGLTTYLPAILGKVQHFPDLIVPGGLELYNPVNQTETEVHFIWKNHTIASHYSISVDFSQLNNACPGIEIHQQNNSFIGYLLWVCGSGYWNITKIDNVGNFTTLSSGFLPSTNTQPYHIVVMATNSTESISINSLLFSTSDSTYSTLPTNFVSLALARDSQINSGSSVFSNFEYQPLP